MADEKITTTGIAAHGASRLPSVDIESFNIELKDDEGFLGDRASKGAFRDILEKWRKPLRKSDEDPFRKEPSENISKKVLDAILVGDDAEASAVVHSAIEDFAQELAHVTRRFLKTKAWEKTERIVVGGGFRDSRLGELGIARTEIILKAENFKIEMLPIRHHPDDAGLIGALHLAPSWIFEGHDSILAVDIGGTNIRPGVIESDGSIEKGAQNLPGNWESSKFNLPASLVAAVPQIGEHDTAIVMHNDGVVQGLSEVPFMQDVKRWGVLTIGTGLGNARFTNRNAKGER